MAVQILTDPLTRFRMLDPRMTTLDAVQELPKKLTAIREMIPTLTGLPPPVASLTVEYLDHFYPGTVGDILRRGSKDEIEMVDIVDRQGIALTGVSKRFIRMFQCFQDSVTQRLFYMSVYSFRTGLTPGGIVTDTMHMEQICSPILIPLCIRSCFLALTPTELKKFRLGSLKPNSDADAINKALERYQGEILDRAFPL